MNHIELNAILYYADFLSLLERSFPVTDNCKYFYIHNTPINSCYMLDLEPEYNEEDPYFLRAKREYIILKDKYGEDGVISFIERCANLSACGAVTAERMLKFIHHFSNKIERKLAFLIYYNWKNNKKYTHTTINEDGELETRECSMYVYHVERSLEKQGLLKGNGYYPERYENKTLESLV